MKFLNKERYKKFGEPLLILAIFLAIRLISCHFFFRIDLTRSQKFSMAATSKAFLKTITEEIEVLIYLDGDLPYNFKRLRDAVDEKLYDIRLQNKNITYRFINPEKLDIIERKRLFSRLKKQNLYATNIFIKDRGKLLEKYTFPIIQLNYNKKRYFINLYNFDTNEQLSIDRSIQNIEYNLLKGIEMILKKQQKKIAIITEIGEPEKNQMEALVKSLKKIYALDFSSLNKEIIDSNFYDAIIIARPTKSFKLEQKYWLDQYIMHGGKVIFFVDAIKVNKKNLFSGLDFAFPNNINIMDMLFRYGVRINQDLIEDRSSMHIPIVVGRNEKKLNIKWLKWPFFPIINNFGNHIITKNLDAISLKFTSSMDPIKVKGVTHYPLILTSRYTRRSFYPVKIDLNDLRKDTYLDQFHQGRFVVGYLLEGNFISYFRNKFLPENIDGNSLKRESNFNKMVVVSCGDLVINEFDFKTKSSVKLGYDFYLNKKFDQEEFILNCLDYLINDNSILYAAGKTYHFPYLNKVKVEKYFLFIQIVNMFLPLLCLFLVGIFFARVNRRNL